MNNIKFENFILEIDDFLPKEYCEDVIQYYDDMEKAGFVIDRMQSDNRENHITSDMNLACHGEFSVRVDYTQNISSYFLDNFWKIAYPEYTKKYSIIKDFNRHTVRALKLQKSHIGEGYHVWHSEIYGRDENSRVLTFIAYINTVSEGGETEFLYYPKRVKSEQGKLVVFPGHFTHAHRGNPPISNEKFILTGWLEF